MNDLVCFHQISPRMANRSVEFKFIIKICLFLFSCVWAFCLYKCEGLLVDLVFTEAEREVSSPETEVTVMSSHDGTGNWNCILCRAASVLDHRVILQLPHVGLSLSLSRSWDSLNALKYLYLDISYVHDSSLRSPNFYSCSFFLPITSLFLLTLCLNLY